MTIKQLIAGLDIMVKEDLINPTHHIGRIEIRGEGRNTKQIAVFCHRKTSNSRIDVNCSLTAKDDPDEDQDYEE